MEERQYTCIVCPKSCVGTLTIHDDGRMETRGFGCRNGEDYAMNEYKDPKRVLTTTVMMERGQYRLLPVVSSDEISRDRFAECLDILYSVKVEAPVAEGEIILRDILGTGVDILAARSMKRV